MLFPLSVCPRFGYGADEFAGGFALGDAEVCDLKGEGKGGRIGGESGVNRVEIEEAALGGFSQRDKTLRGDCAGAEVWH